VVGARCGGRAPTPGPSLKGGEDAARGWEEEEPDVRVASFGAAAISGFKGFTLAASAAQAAASSSDNPRGARFIAL